ncbi:hypothetical protein PT974_00944 [Cladobotryum mycophilum]|uniref:Uncharacterized protein n=1 Tax=Cladobotryum mycophilum TaxID=491253 RepID=A0ABR0T2A5_9HYPO
MPGSKGVEPRLKKNEKASRGGRAAKKWRETDDAGTGDTRYQRFSKTVVVRHTAVSLVIEMDRPPAEFAKFHNVSEQNAAKLKLVKLIKIVAQTIESKKKHNEGSAQRG